MKGYRVVGILGGSFDPVHVGHLMLASYVQQVGDLDEVWLSLSPANPLKVDRHPASDADRLEMLKMAVPAGCGLRAVGYELELPRPSYTCDYLDWLADRFPDTDFRLIIGADNLAIFDQWKRSDYILERYGVMVYPRPGYVIEDVQQLGGVTLVDAPQLEISSTFIRDAVARGLDVNFFLPAGVYNYIMTHNLYQ